MSFNKRMQKQGANPSELTGVIIGRLMNVFNANIYKWRLQYVSILENAVCPGIGCGGGKAVKFFARRTKNGEIYGLDHSPRMVNLSNSY